MFNTLIYSVHSGTIFWCVWYSFNITHRARLHCTLSSFGFCSRELIVLLFAVEMDRSTGRQRLVEFYSAIQLPKCAFIAHVTPIINYSPRHSAGLAGCYGNGPDCKEHRGYMPLLIPLLAVSFRCLPVIYSVSDRADWTESPLSDMKFKGFNTPLLQFSIFKH